MTIEPTAEWWRGVDQSWDELVALLKGCSLAEQQTGAATRRQHDAKVMRRLAGVGRPVLVRPVRQLARAA